MRKLLPLLTILALIACNRDKVETQSPDSGSNQNVLDTAASGNAIPDATATDVTLPIGGSPADASAVTESMAEATETATTTTTSGTATGTATTTPPATTSTKPPQ